MLPLKHKITSVNEDGEKLDPLCTVGGNVNDEASVKNGMAVPQKTKHVD